jgi:AraC-like DNA-binding protein
MDFCFYHLDALARRYPYHLPVKIIAYDPDKTKRVRHRFDTYNYSLILNGDGYYKRGSEVWKVRPPFMFTAIPGEWIEYGPERHWEEIFIVYDAESLPELESAGFTNVRAWSISTPGNISTLVDVLKGLLSDVERQGAADKIDRTCESLLLECRLGEQPRYSGEKEHAIQKIRAFVEENYLENHDFDRLARSYGLSPTTFRRHWARLVGEPPWRFVMSMRIQKAKRLLLESGKPVNEIASSLNFSDPLYFSRKFRERTGMTASRYRKINRFSLAVADRSGPEAQGSA